MSLSTTSFAVLLLIGLAMLIFGLAHGMLLRPAAPAHRTSSPWTMAIIGLVVTAFALAGVLT